MSSILVTGANGNVGSEVVRGLLAATAAGAAGDVNDPGGGADGTDGVSATIRAAVSDPSRCPNVPDRVDRVRFDFLDPSTFAAALDGVDRVFLMRPPHMADAEAFRPFLSAMRKGGVQQVVFLSLLGVEKNPVVPHHAIEKAVVASGLGYTMLRPSFFMQNLSTTHLEDIVTHGEIIVPAGNGRTSFIDVRDIAAAAVVVLTEPGHVGKAYALTGSEALTYSDCARLISEAGGRTVVYTKPSGREFAAHMAAQGHSADFIKVMRAIYLVAKLRMGGTITGDLRELLDREPITFAQFARDNAALFAGTVDEQLDS